MLPGRDGIDVCRQIRSESGVPIVMLTAKSDTVDVVLGLESGADDYVVKPFSPKELVARIRVRLRRTDEPAPELILALAGARTAGSDPSEALDKPFSVRATSETPPLRSVQRS